MKIILGSQSKGRRKMMEEMGLEFEVMPADIDEKAIRHENPTQLTLDIALAKAETLKTRISEPAILVTSDQVVVYDGVIREKPINEAQAREFLSTYGRLPVQTVGSVVVTNTANGKQATGTDTAFVVMNPFTEEDINAILKEGNVFNYAGGFTIDGDLWAKHVVSIDGTRDSVIGLPKELTQRLMQEVM